MRDRGNRESFVYIVLIIVGVAFIASMHNTGELKAEIADLISTRTEQHLIIGRLTGQVEAYKDAFDYTVRMEQLGLMEESRK